MAKREMQGEAKDVYAELRQDLIRLHANWQIFRQLYTVSDEQMRLLGNTAPGFFRLLQDMIADTVVISVSRIMEHSRKYASLPTLLRLLKNQVDHSDHEKLEKGLKTLKNHCEPIIQHRHRRVAHKVRKGESPQLDVGPERLPPIPRGTVDNLLLEMDEFMNEILLCFESTMQVYEPIIGGDAEVLVHFLKKGYDTQIAGQPKV